VISIEIHNGLTTYAKKWVILEGRKQSNCQHKEAKPEECEAGISRVIRLIYSMSHLYLGRQGNEPIGIRHLRLSPKLFQSFGAAAIPFVVFVSYRILGIKILVIFFSRIKG